MTERDKMLAGALYDPLDAELTAARERARDLCQALNASRESESARRREILGDLLGDGGDTAWIQPPFFCDYGTNIHLGKKVFFNFNCIVLDGGRWNQMLPRVRGADARARRPRALLALFASRARSRNCRRREGRRGRRLSARRSQDLLSRAQRGCSGQERPSRMLACQLAPVADVAEPEVRLQ